MRDTHWGLPSAGRGAPARRQPDGEGPLPDGTAPWLRCPRVAAFLARYLYSPHVEDCLLPFKQMVRVRPSGDDHSGHGLKSLPRSSRICPANDRETLRNDGNGRSIKSAGQASDSAIAAGSEIGPENTLKVETRVRTPLGLRAQTPGQGTSSKSSGSLNRDSNAEYPEDIPSQIVRSRS
jgi:hypothetical protein